MRATAQQHCWQQLPSVTTPQVPKTPGIYVWCARAPDAGHNQWFAVYMGKANKLRDRLQAYFNSDGTFGPQKEAHKMGVLKEMYEKGFDFQIRWVGVFGMKARMSALSAGQHTAHGSAGGATAGVRWHDCLSHVAAVSCSREPVAQLHICACQRCMGCHAQPSQRGCAASATSLLASPPARPPHAPLWSGILQQATAGRQHTPMRP